MTNTEKLLSIASEGTLFSELSKEKITYSYLCGYISAAISKLRLKKEMSQAEFAHYMGVSQSMVSKWESADYNFTIEKLSEIFAKLDQDIKINVFDSNELNKLSKTPAQIYNFSSVCKDLGIIPKWENIAATTKTEGTAIA